MTDTEKGAREVFEALKRPGDKWHISYNETIGTIISTPEGMVWIMERLPNTSEIHIKKWETCFTVELNCNGKYSAVAKTYSVALYSAVLKWVREGK